MRAMPIYILSGYLLLTETLGEALERRGYKPTMLTEVSQATQLILTTKEPVLLIGYATENSLTDLTAISRLIRSNGDESASVALVAICTTYQVANDLVQMGGMPDALLLTATGLCEVIFAIEEIKRGARYRTAHLRNITESSGQSLVAHPSQSIQTLTKREREIMRYIADSKTSDSIAQHLFISVATVNNHKANIMGKLNLSGRHTLLTTALMLRPWLDVMA